MALTTNSFGGVDLLATATDLDNRVTGLEGERGSAAPSDPVLTSRVQALEADLAAIKTALLPVKE